MNKPVICNCNVCSEAIEFDPQDVSKTVVCPHCGIETVLYFHPKPGKPELIQPPISPASPIPTIDSAIKVTETAISQSGNIEETLEAIGRVFFFLSILIGGIAIFVICMIGFQNPGPDETPNITGLVIIGVVSVASGIVTRTIFRAIAEIIRLLRQLVKLQSDGKTAQSNPT
jgi:hypothetical protein